jgi:hypothetical protein
MKTVSTWAIAIAASLAATISFADSTRDCMLEGTVVKDDKADQQGVNVKFHSVSKYDEDANCRVRRGQKMQFQLPDDPRLQDAEDGSSVKYRYRTESDGSANAELISIGA